MRFSSIILLAMVAPASGFVVHQPKTTKISLMPLAASEVELGLTPELTKMTEAFSAIADEQVRYKQLLYMAQHTKEANNMPEASKTPENKVPGCLSTVYVDGTAEFSEEAGDYIINFIGDSDGLLTRGLVALLVRCLSGNTAADIQKVDPQFIKVAKIEQSLTPGRNNGFLNMLRSMKQKALRLDQAARQGSETDGTKGDFPDESAAAGQTNDPSLGPKGNAMLAALRTLKPTSLTLIDNSHQHAGHAGNDMEGESHFDLQIVSEAFEGLNLVKRHRLIYMILGDLMPRIHALQISSLTPSEADERGT